MGGCHAVVQQTARHPWEPKSDNIEPFTSQQGLFSGHAHDITAIQDKRTNLNVECSFQVLSKYAGLAIQVHGRVRYFTLFVPLMSKCEE
jgi:hypothetical protein